MNDLPWVTARWAARRRLDAERGLAGQELGHEPRYEAYRRDDTLVGQTRRADHAQHAALVRATAETRENERDVGHVLQRRLAADDHLDTAAGQPRQDRPQPVAVLEDLQHAPQVLAVGKLRFVHDLGQTGVVEPRRGRLDGPR